AAAAAAEAEAASQAAAEIQEVINSGASIVEYANQFVGNPYVWGGNSLTSGIDCSHFVWQVLQNNGVYNGEYRTSGEWVNAGEAVSSLAEAQAGDVICYSGHVAIYDGEGGIVEAKGSAYGITHDRAADYKDIVAIRRFT
ncbi:MAG: NlpC/P60 family protein, partial [Lachnospiraceae bacterium]|nr:NlpC/P60 family protein [Lachnospiraceae bacterium]